MKVNDKSAKKDCDSLEHKKTFQEKILESIDKMCLMDDSFMSVVLQHKECMELVLNIILY